MSAHQLRQKSMRRVLHRCGICGQFVKGGYPMGFYCDRHCWRCICSNCPGVDGPGVYRVSEEVADAA